MTNYLLLIMAVCLMSRSLYQVQADADYNSDDYYSYDEYATEKIIEPITSKPTIKTTISTTEIIFPDLTEKTKPIYKCPEICSCSDGTTFLNCTNRNLTNIPKTLPLDAIEINLSFNQIEIIDENDFSNYKDIRNIILSHNKIRNIESNVFKHNHLTNLDLSSNLLTMIYHDTFSNLPNLRMLNLKGNPLIIPTEEVFLTANDLEELNLDNCNLIKLHEETFSNLRGLIFLSLAGNPLNEYDFNVNAFTPLQHLEKLILPTISSTSIEDLCGILKTIDIVSTETYNVSCFIIASGSSFEESTVTMKTITLSPKEIITPPSPTNESIPFVQQIRNEVDQTTLRTIKSRIQNKTNSEVINNSTIINNKDLNENLTRNETEPIGNPNKAALPSDPINKILIGIIVVAFVGLLIGIICRKDYCGIKTKMCRKRRQTPSDNVQPHEEVPLNKV